MKAWLAMMLSASQSIPATPDILLPSGKWTVEYADSMCVLQRDYGTGPQKVTLGFRPLPLSEQNEMVLVTQDAGGRLPKMPFGKVSLQLGTAGPIVTGTYRSWAPVKMPESRVSIISLDARAEDITAPETLIIGRAKLPTVRLRPMATPAAFTALKACQDDLVKSWGIDLAEEAKIVTPAKGTPAEWISDTDYPPQAVRDRQTGAVSIVWTIGTAGTVSNCQVTMTSGHPLLDQAACAAITRRARYKPALDKDGRPIPSHSSRRVIWSVPE